MMLWLAVTAWLGAQEPPPKGPPDWKVEVVAKYPQIKYPSVLCFAPDGRLFVGEDPMDMEGPVNKPVDRILCFHPDGKVTVFAEGLYAVFGMQYLDGKLYVHHTPRLSVFRDELGVGKDREDLVECTNPNPAPGFNDHIPSQCRLAMDGFLYISTGDKGIYGAVGKDGKTAEIHGGGLARIRPDGTELEVYSTGTRNHLDVAVTAEDEMFTYDNTDDGLGWWCRVSHMVDGGYYGYPWDYKPRRPYTLWMMGDYGGGAPTASIAYTEDALPAKYAGNLFLSDWGRKEILRLAISRDGATWKIDSTEKFLTGQSGGEFRPVGIAVAPDGMSLWFCDWNFGGWTTKGKETGRLIKATYTGGPSLAAPRPAWYLPAAMGRPFDATADELVGGLSHPSRDVRLVAQRRLVDRKATRELEGVVSHGKAPAVWHAIWALDALGGSQAIREALKDADPSVRRQAARELGTRKVKGSMIALIGLLKDPDPSVRFQVATALGRIAHPVAVPALQAALQESDLFARYAAIRAIDRIGRANSTAWAEIVKGLSSDQPRIREGTLFAIRETYEEPLVAALVAAPRSVETLSALAEIHRMPPAWKGQWWGTQPAAQPRPAKTVDYGGTKMALEAIRSGLTDPAPAVRRAAVEGTLASRDAGSAAALRELYARETDPEVKKAILRAQGALKDSAAADEVAAALRDPALQGEALGAAESIGGPAVVRALGEFVESTASVAGMEALGRLKTGGAAVARHLAHPEPKVAAQAAVSLGLIGGREAEEALLGGLQDPRPEVRKAAIGSLGLLGVRGAVPALLRMYLDPVTRFEAIGALARVPDLRAIEAYLEGLGGRNAPVRDACRKAVGALGETALPAIEQKLDQQLLSGEVISELQRLFNRPVPIVQWKILGSFPNPCPEPFDVAAPPMDREFKDPKGNPSRWRPAKVAAETGRVTLNGQMPTTEDSTAYGVTEIESATDREVEFVGGSDDTLVVWLNGTKVFEDLTDKGWKADQYHFRGKLQAGRNLVVIKCGNHGGAWEFSLAYPVARKGRLFEAVAKKLDPKAYAEYAKKTPGDPVRGRALFLDPKGVACVKCHKLSGEGGEVGPDLTGVGLKYGRDHFIESILYPSAKILDGYRTTVVLTKSGDVKSGRLLGETAEELTLLDQEGKRLAIRKADLEQRRESDVSMMPEGLNTGLSLQDFADLVGFLESLREAAPRKP